VALVLVWRGEGGSETDKLLGAVNWGLLLALVIVPVLTVAFPLALAFQVVVAVEFAVGHTAGVEVYVLRLGCCCCHRMGLHAPATLDQFIFLQHLVLLQNE
jgi:hypothetical protein